MQESSKSSDSTSRRGWTFKVQLSWTDVGEEADSDDCLSDAPPSNPADGRLYYNDQTLILPKRLIESDPACLFTKSNFARLPADCQARLLTLLPRDCEEAASELLEKLWDLQSSYFRGLHPVELFKKLLGSGYFTQVD